MTRDQSSAIVALSELRAKTLVEIQFDTAITWAYRAWAARKLATAARNVNDATEAHRFEHDAVEYEHEAIEHAALCGVDELLITVRQIIAGE